MSIANVDAGLVWNHVLRILRGRCPTAARAAFASARLVAIRKKEGSGDCRPISIGEAWRRVAGKVAVLVMRGKAAALLKTVGQLGVGEHSRRHRSRCPCRWPRHAADGSARYRRWALAVKRLRSARA